MINNSDFEPNKIYTDEFGRISGIFLVDKPVGKTSHDIADEFRRKFQTRKVGHAGALDPFATGLLIILVGKALKLADSFLGLEKEYEAEVALGFKTDTLDTEGKIVDSKESSVESLELLRSKLWEALNSFKPEYLQEVPIYSSVKVNGDKLRELIRRCDASEILKNEDDSSTIKFLKEGKIWKELIIPRKLVKIIDIELKDLKLTKVSDYNFEENFTNQLKENSISEFYSATITSKVSKGTYIRKLAEDVGDKLGIPAMLVNLKRTKVGEYKVEDSYKD